MISLLCLLISSAFVWAEQPEPFIKGGPYDKPHLFESDRGKVAVGGYAEAHARYEEEEGVVEERTFVPKRFNVFFHAVVSERIRLAAELEFEDGTEEILLELAAIDFELHPSLSLRTGMLLTPLGRFNLAHDSPTNKLTDRPLVSTQIIPTALSEPGIGIYGAFFYGAGGRVTYELYAVNGFGSGIIEDSDEGTRIEHGKQNFEDNNNSPAFAGRIAAGPSASAELGVSWHVGQYNESLMEDLNVDEARDVRLFAIDGLHEIGNQTVEGEYSRASIDIPASLRGSIFAENQDGIYLQWSASFFHGRLGDLVDSYFEGVVRFDRVDFDTNLAGDDVRQWSFGLNFRPTHESVLKLNYFKNWSHDRNNVLARRAGVLFSVATYF